MDENYIESKVIEILRERTTDKNRLIARETPLHEIGDSLDRVEAIMELEDEFEISISDSDDDKIRTVGELIVYVEELSKAALGAVGNPPAAANEAHAEDS